jgi:hypothetical protein
LLPFRTGCPAVPAITMPYGGERHGSPSLHNRAVISARPVYNVFNVVENE